MMVQIHDDELPDGVLARIRVVREEEERAEPVAPPEPAGEEPDG